MHPTPVSKRLRKVDKIVLGIIGALTLLCCGGAMIVGATAEDPVAPAASVPAPNNIADRAPAPTSPTPDAAVAVEASRSASTEASRSASVQASRSAAAEVKRAADEKKARERRAQRREQEQREAEEAARLAEEQERQEQEQQEQEEEPAAAYYANCSAARDAGAAPLYAGEPGYRAGLDRDKDGIACDT